MFINLGIVEIFVISIAAYIILGPKRLPEIGRKAGQVSKAISQETKGIDKEIKEIKETVMSVSDEKN